MFKKGTSLKTRVLLLFLIGFIVPFICVSVISFYVISGIQKDKYQQTVLTSLGQVVRTFDSTLDELKKTSLTFGNESLISAQVHTLIETDVMYERFELMTKIKNEMNLLVSVNSNIGHLVFFQTDFTDPVISSFEPKSSASLEGAPLLYSNYYRSYYGPIQSNKVFSGQLVLAVLVQLSDLPGKELHLYVESASDIQKTFFDSNKFSEGMGYLILTNENQILYSDNESFHAGEIFDRKNQDITGSISGYQYFSEKSSYGFQVVSLIPMAEYNKELYDWFRMMVIFAVAFLILSLFLAGLLWRTVYHPLRQFDKSVLWIKQADFDRKTPPTNIPEFDAVLDNIVKMKIEIMELIDTVVKKEKRRGELELEKLLYQINPHFLSNSLNTVHWMAKQAHNDDIDTVVLALNKLLMYNLGKLNSNEYTGQFASLQDELDAVRQYLTLQKFRYDFTYDIKVQGDYLKQAMPRFILQPIVENSIKYGLSDNAEITIEVHTEPVLKIWIRDKGPGISAQKIAEILSGNDDSTQWELGIGLSYVQKMLCAIYGGNHIFSIDRSPQSGTCIYLQIPPITRRDNDDNPKGGANHDPDHHSGG